MMFRPQRGSLDAAMFEAEEFDGTLAGLTMLLREKFEPGWWPKQESATTENTVVEKYARDDRIGWDTYIVLVNRSPVGFTNGAVVG